MLQVPRSFSTRTRQNGFIELREYTLKPEGVKPYLDLCNGIAEVRKAHLPFLGMMTPETGGVLNKVVHFYAYEDFDRRHAARKAIAKHPEWQSFLAESRKHVLGPQESKCMREATQVYEALQLPPTASFVSPSASTGPGMYEVREYLLHPGYGSVPKVLESFKQGLPHKVAKDTEGKLVFFGFTDVGLLNNVIEIWRYPSYQSCMTAREGARTVQPWRDCIGAVTPHVQWFRSTFMNPVATSPWQ